MSLALPLCTLVFVMACGSSSTPPSPAPGSSSSSDNSSTKPPSSPADASGPDTTTLAITSVDPAKGDVDGGTFVVIKGHRFMADGARNVKVYFGSRQGSIVRFQSDSELVVQAPGGKRDEKVDIIVVFDPGGQLTLTQAFTFVEKS